MFIQLFSFTAFASIVYLALSQTRRQFQEKVLEKLQALIQPKSTTEPDTPDIQDRVTHLPRAAQILLDCSAPNMAHLELMDTVPHKVVVQDQVGEILLNEKWCSFKARTFFSNKNTGLVWQAKVNVLPFVSVDVVDTFVDGKGWLEARLLGVVPVASAQGDKIDAGEVVRFLAELAWTPENILLNPEVEFRTISGSEDHSFTASTMVNGHRSTVQFDLVGKTDELLEEFFGLECTALGGRDRMEADGTMRKRPWKGEMSHFKQFDSYLYPTKAEASWVLDDGLVHPCFKCEVKNVFVVDADPNLCLEEYLL